MTIYIVISATVLLSANAFKFLKSVPNKYTDVALVLTIPFVFIHPGVVVATPLLHIVKYMNLTSLVLFLLCVTFVDVIVAGHFSFELLIVMVLSACCKG